MMTGIGMGFGLLGVVFMFLFWGGLILLAVWLVRVVFGNNQPIQEPPLEHHPNPREILDRRYARGEITREQYELICDDIG